MTVRVVNFPPDPGLYSYFVKPGHFKTTFADSDDEDEDHDDEKSGGSGDEKAKRKAAKKLKKRQKKDAKKAKKRVKKEKAAAAAAPVHPCDFPPGACVKTSGFGPALVTKFRPEDGIYQVCV